MTNTMEMEEVEGLNYYKLPDTLDGYAVLKDGVLWLSFIVSKDEGKGNFRKFLDEIEEKYTIKIPTPSDRMFKILKKRDYKETLEYFEEFGEGGLVMLKIKNGLS